MKLPSLGDQFVVLLEKANRNIPLERRQKLWDAVHRFLETTDVNPTSHEEIFSMLGSMAMIEMTNYAEQLQVDIGTEIIKEAFGEK
jgi:hypothetical protein